MDNSEIYEKVICTVIPRRKMHTIVVNPFQMKLMPGKKNYVADSVWMIKLMYNGMISEGFILDRTLARRRIVTHRYRRFV